ncbi:MAG: thiamine pyrophosphate-dependent enzyme [Spirochaetes bacterium]|nr:thiamine pyrophosphate-dependent enzyme [Spirochaetota bacterium]
MNTIDTRAQAIAQYGTISKAIAAGAIAPYQDITVSEAIVLGLFNQNVTRFFGVFGHGSTDIAEVLRIYEHYGLVTTYNVRHETAAAHAATAYGMLTGEVAAVITSIGPGALHAFAGSLASASNGVGVYHIYGDETTHDEGFNMQQIPKDEQGLFLKLCSTMGNAYALYEPWSVIAALKRGAVVTGVPFAQPFFLLAPMNVQPAVLHNFNLLQLSSRYTHSPVMCNDDAVFAKAVAIANSASRITIKIGNGARGCGKELCELAEILHAAIVSGPSSTGIVPYSHPHYMSVGGSKGSLCGNFAMNQADMVIIVGARGVCQWDCSGTAWKNARAIINFNTNPYHAFHYTKTISIVGDAKHNLRLFIAHLKNSGVTKGDSSKQWLAILKEKKSQWQSFKKLRYENPTLYDDTFKRDVLTQPAAIKAACEFADSHNYIKVFDAGDVQANGFQIIEDEHEGNTITETGSSYMGFAPSSILVSGIIGRRMMAFCGDGSFMMNPQILIDGVQHNAQGIIVIFDNRQMGAITGLQYAQYGKPYKTNDSVNVDYVALAHAVHGVRAFFGGYTTHELTNALNQAHSYKGLSVIHVPVYSGSNELGGMGVFGSWNVGNWCHKVQEEYHRLGW